MTTHVEVRRGTYHDSVTLLQVSRDVAELDGIRDAVVAMATELNLAVLADLGFEPADIGDVTPNDLIVALRCVDDRARQAGLRSRERRRSDGATHKGDPTSC